MIQPLILAPERLHARHDVSRFANGKHSSLDSWLRDRALASEGMSARTYVVCAREKPQRVVGYYALSTAMEQRIALPNAKLRRAMPDQVPLLLIGRLAVDRQYQGKGLGADLLSDGLRRCLEVSEIAGVRAIITHAIDDDAVRFYQHYGFINCPLGERVLLQYSIIHRRERESTRDVARLGSDGRRRRTILRADGAKGVVGGRG